MKINVAKKKFLLCFRPDIESDEQIGLGNNNNNQHARRKVFLFQKTPSTTHDHGRTHNKRSVSRFIKNVLLGNALTKRIRKRRRSTKNSESPATKEPQTKSDKNNNNNQTFSKVDANTEDAVFSLSPSTSLYSIQTQESNNYGDGGGGCCKVAAAEQERGPRWSSRGNMVTYYIKTTFRYVVYALLAVFGVTVFLRFNGVFLTCVWLYLAGGPVTPLFSGERQPTSRRRPYLVY